MPMRTLEELQRDQAALLADYRARLPTARDVGAGSPTSRSPQLQWGKVIEVVTSSVEYGPHLIVQAYIPTGVPPVFTAASTATTRCYPAPGRAVTDYAVDEFVRLTKTGVGIIVERLA